MVNEREENPIAPHSGRRPLLLDFTFQGGTLTNNASFINAPAYYLDSANAGTKTGMRLRFLGSRKCIDSGQTSAALCRIGAEVTASGSGNSLTMSLASQWTAANKPVVKCIGVVGNLIGTDLAACNRLYIIPALYEFGTAGAGFGFHFTFFKPIPYSASYAGVTLWSQAAYDDSKNGQFRLTRASTGRIPIQPAPDNKLRVVERPQLTTTGNLQSNHLYLPLVFYN